MGLVTEVARLYQAIINQSNIRISRWPAGAQGVKVTAGATPNFSAWAQVVPQGTIPNPAWITAIFLENPDDAGAAEVWVVDLAQGAPGQEVSLSSGTST